MNAFEDEAFSEAVKPTGRKRLIIGGLHTEICLTFASVQGLKNGYDDAPESRDLRTPAPCRQRRSRSRPSCSATERVRSPSLPAKSPPFVLLVVVATGNHFFFGAVTGAFGRRAGPRQRPPSWQNEQLRPG
jgi:hypothetical protein